MTIDHAGSPKVLGQALTPLQVVSSLRWLGDLAPDEIVQAIRTAARHDLSAIWPELDAAALQELRRQCATMSKNRLAVWMTRRGRQPTWLEVRALISGLHHVLE